ncbi:hypothetical protein, variant 2 [Aphanomyces invadans]|nr:hypothetical protein, variant 2 [Aphanomyces invadans]ETV92491.1 hypothetical protein, variant 2 [Aphanomyces invadans]|eukprot:XP_008878798.1 hypothetical protein, variant 2 [Aphanomyces invadans]
MHGLQGRVLLPFVQAVQVLQVRPLPYPSCVSDCWCVRTVGRCWHHASTLVVRVNIRRYALTRFSMISQGARGLCNVKLSWGSAFLDDVSKSMRLYKRDVTQDTREHAPPGPVEPTPLQQTQPPPSAPAKPHDPRKPPPSVRNKPRDPRQQPPVKEEVSQPQGTAPVRSATAPAPVVAHPSAPTVNPVAVQRPVKQEPASRVVHVAGESSVLPTRDDKTFITSSSLPNMPPLPHVRDNYLKGVMLDNYNKFNDQADQLDKAIRKLEVEARMNVSSASMSVALSAVNRRSELQRALEDVFRQRDEAVAQVIVYDPPVLAQYDAAQDPANPLYKAPVHNPTIAQRFVPLKHGMCAKIELKIQGLLTQWVRLQDQMVAALSDHDVPAMERLQEEIETLESQMCLQDTQRAAQFVEISAFSDRVRQLITHYRENVPRT